MDRRKRLVTEEEARLWRETMRNTVPLRRGADPIAAAPAATAPPSPPPRDDATALPQKQISFVSPAKAAAVRLPPLEHGRTPGLDKANAERLRQGAKPIEARLDLHGLTQQAAHGALNHFIGQAVERGLRCVLVITGKGNRDGTGVLRTQVPRWLNEAALRGHILAFSHAQPKDGGEGALYVLLKRKR